MCACEHDFTCARCRKREALPLGLDDEDRERFAEMLFTDEWPERAAPMLADLEANPVAA